MRKWSLEEIPKYLCLCSRKMAMSLRNQRRRKQPSNHFSASTAMQLRTSPRWRERDHGTTRSRKWKILQKMKINDILKVLSLVNYWLTQKYLSVISYIGGLLYLLFSIPRSCDLMSAKLPVSVRVGLLAWWLSCRLSSWLLGWLSISWEFRTKQFFDFEELPRICEAALGEGEKGFAYLKDFLIDDSGNW